MHDSEADALRALGARLAVLPFDETQLAGLGAKLVEGYRDVVNLNIDRTVQLALAAGRDRARAQKRAGRSCGEQPLQRAADRPAPHLVAPAREPFAACLGSH